MSVEFEEFTLSDREIQAVIVKVAADVAFLREQFHRWAPLLERLETPMGAIGATRRLRRNMFRPDVIEFGPDAVP